MAEKNIFFGQALIFTEVVTPINSIKRVVQQLLFSDSVTFFTLNQEVNQTLYLSDTATQTRDDFQAVSQSLFFTQLAEHPKSVQHVVQVLPLFDSVTRKTDHVTQTLTFNQTTSGAAAKGAQQTLLFTEILSEVTVFSRSILDTLTFIQGASAYLEDPNFIAINLPTLTQTGTVVLSQGSLSLTLRSPNFDNNFQLEFNRINRRTRGHDLIIFRDADWPKSEVLTMSFSGLTQTQVWDLLAFMKTTMGQNITLIDHENVEWLGVITTPTNEVVQEGRGCKFNASFSFQGNQV